MRNPTGKNAFSIDDHGYLAIDGNIVENSTGEQLTPVEGIKEFVVKGTINNIETVLARFYPKWDFNPANPCEIVWPTLFLRGKLIKNQATLSPPAKSFRVHDHAGNVVAYISSEYSGSYDDPVPAGSLVLKNDAFVGANPDPEAYRLDLLLYDTFEDGSYGAPVTAYDTARYHTPPGWYRGQYTDPGDWWISNVGGNHILQTGGEYGGGGTLLIDAPILDHSFDINLDFMCTSNTSADTFRLDLGQFCDLSSSLTPFDVYVELLLNQTTQNVAIYRTDSPVPLGVGDFNMDADKWYEMHVYFSDPNRMCAVPIRDFQVWIRERDIPGRSWQQTIMVSDLNVVPFYTSPRSLSIHHEIDHIGTWSFDNFILSGSD